tara:strand:+ start:365 stop:1057 length:693 start_codon:yes stop_codon:yes gene_type:complete
MGYLDNSSITVDAILTKRGRELLAQSHKNNPDDVNVRFKITQFALGDDEIDYQLFNENHPNGTQYAAEAIENMPIIEALPNGINSMNSKLITLSRGTRYIPYITHNYGSSGIGPITINSAAMSIEVNTFNLNGTGLSSEQYIWTLLDGRLAKHFVGQPTTTGAPTAAEMQEFSTIAHSISVKGTSVSLTPTESDALFSATVTTRSTSIIVEGVTSGAVVSIPIQFKSSTT